VADVQAERAFEIAGLSDPLRFCGHLDRNLSALEGVVPVALAVDGNRILVRGEAGAVDSAHEILARMYDAAMGGAQVTPDDVALAARDTLAPATGASRALPKTLFTTHRGREIRPRTEGQRTFVEAMLRSPLTFAIGPAGTGKTFLAMTMAVRALRSRETSKIILARPAVEAGERLGFLPGDLKDKVDPYLRPLYDALFELMDENVVARALERGLIEVAPLAYMRGRTLSDAYIILDEAQNATHEQLKMFLTRLGHNAKMIVSGDITQVDLPAHIRPGLLDAPARFAHLDEIAVVELTESDVVRHPLVAKIVAAYARGR
jgi:phosphate starvation-inducible protein PhoH and related proteins